MSVYYNDIDPAAVAVLRHLISEGVIADGIVDDRSIKDVLPGDLIGFAQCHFFAGGGLWSVAARLAGWADSRPIWTGSCPCQPFSAAGKGGGTDDPRHLWPDFLRLIGACRDAGHGPPVIVGEQVSGAAGYGWFDGVRADLAAEGYASRAVDFPASAVDAPHQRNRLYWAAVGQADAAIERDRRKPGELCEPQGQRIREIPREGHRRFQLGHVDADGRHVDQVDAKSIGRGEGRPEPIVLSGRAAAAGADASSVTQGDAERTRLEGHGGDGDQRRRPQQDRPVASPDGARAASYVALGHADPERRLQPQGPEPILGGRRGHTDDRRNGTYWSDAEWLICHDGKARRAKPGLRLLVDGLPGRVDLWRVGGNAIVPQAAVEVIAALREALDMRAAA